MGERSTERTVSESEEPPSTEELLAQTEDLLSGDDPSREPDRDFGDSTSSRRGEGDVDRVDDADGRLGGLRRHLTRPFRRSNGTEGQRSSGHSRLERVFSVRAFLGTTLLLGAGLLAGGTLIPIFGRHAGVFLAALCFGLVSSNRRYLEVGLAGGTVAGLAAVLNHLSAVVIGLGVPAAAMGAGLGVLVALIGFYAGRDLRKGLDEPV